MVGLLTEFKPVESRQLIYSESRPATGWERRRKSCFSASVPKLCLQSDFLWLCRHRESQASASPASDLQGMTGTVASGLCPWIPGRGNGIVSREDPSAWHTETRRALWGGENINVCVGKLGTFTWQISPNFPHFYGSVTQRQSTETILRTHRAAWINPRRFWKLPDIGWKCQAHHKWLKSERNALRPDHKLQALKRPPGDQDH